MTSRAVYLTRLVEFARQLHPERLAASESRKAFVARIVEFAARLREHREQDAPGLAAFRECVMPQGAAILLRLRRAMRSRVDGLPPARKSWLFAIADAPDVLGQLGRGRDEVMHTRMISRFLDVKGERVDQGLAVACATAFEELVRRKGGLPPLGLAGGWARAESPLGPRMRIDIEIGTETSHLFLEAKIDAKEREGQLPDYAEHLERRRAGKPGVLVFLTADKEHVSKSETKHVPISFGELLAAWLPVTCAVPSASLLSTYLRSVAQHVLEIAGDRDFDNWSVSTQRAALEFVEKEMGADHGS